MKHLIKHLRTTFYSVLDLVRYPRLPDHYLHFNVPYYAQWESRELVEKIMSKEIATEDDPHWKSSGAVSASDYAQWSWSCCGMACLKMILATTQHTVVPTIILAKQCLAYGGYKLPLKQHPGLYHQPFVQFIRQEFGLNGQVAKALTLRKIEHTLSQGDFVIASVATTIHRPDILPTRKGGHLVLLVGYDHIQQTITFHNPSGFADTQEYASLSYADFTSFFDNKGIIVQNTAMG